MDHHKDHYSNKGNGSGLTLMADRSKENYASYFNHTRGLGVLATSNGAGEVDAAIYARPHVLEDDVIAFFMADRRSHANLQSNPKAAYLFKEQGDRYKGKRLFLTKIREELESESDLQLKRRKTYASEDEGKSSDSFVVYFRIDKVVPLVGSGICPVAHEEGTD